MFHMTHRLNMEYFLDFILQEMTAAEFAELVRGIPEGAWLTKLAQEREGDALVQHVMYPNGY